MRHLRIFLSLLLISVFSQTLGQTSNPKVDSLLTLIQKVPPADKPALFNQLSELLRRDPRGMEYAQEALAHARVTENKEQEALALKNIGIAQGYENEYDLALKSMLQSLAIADENRAWIIAGDDATNIGTIYHVVLSKYDSALEFYLKALAYYEKASHKKGVASALSGLGIAYTREKKFDRALEYLNRSLTLFIELEEKREVPKIKVNIGTAYRDMQEYGLALAQLNEAIAGFDATKNPRGKAHALFIVADINRIQKNYTAAINNLNEALVLNKESNHKNSIIDCLLQLGKTYTDMGNHAAAAPYFSEVVTIATEIHKRESLSQAYQHLSDIYEKQRNFEEAYSFLKLHKIYHDSIFSAETSNKIQEMQARFDSEKKEQEIILLKQEKALNQIYLFAAAGLVVVIVVIAMLVINRQKLKLRNERELAEKENQLNEERKTLLEAELRNKELSENQLHDQIQFKNKELASYTLNLIQKNEILENLKQSVEDIKTAPDSQVRQKLNVLVNMVNYSFHLDREWENFKMHFEQVHQDFFKKLLEQYPDLSANDLKLCSLIKLNLDNRGIAAILNISQESAKVARHRLRKKLDLPADQTLISFLSTIEEKVVV